MNDQLDRIERKLDLYLSLADASGVLRELLSNPPWPTALEIWNELESMYLCLSSPQPLRLEAIEEALSRLAKLKAHGDAMKWSESAGPRLCHEESIYVEGYEAGKNASPPWPTVDQLWDAINKTRGPFDPVPHFSNIERALSKLMTQSMVTK